MQGEGKHKELQGKTTGAAGKEEVSVVPQWENSKRQHLAGAGSPGNTTVTLPAYLKTCAGRKKRGAGEEGNSAGGFVMAVTGIGATIQVLCPYTSAGIKGCWSNSFFKVNTGYV